jgi:hypothetical protein
MRYRQQLFLLLAALLLAACSNQTMLNRFAGPEEQALALSALEDVRRADAPALRGKMLPRFGIAVPEVMPAMHQAFPPGARPVPVGASVRKGRRRTETRIVYALDGSSGHAAAEIRMSRYNDGPLRVTAMRVRPSPVSLLDARRFPFRSLTAGDLLMLALGAAMVATVVAAIVRVWRSGRFGYRWLWTLGCLVGFTTWFKAVGSAKLVFQPLHVQLLGAGIIKSDIFAPWVIMVGIPVVAIVVLCIRRGPRETEHAEEVAQGA